ncbi:MAG TPA: hypothetical protein PLI09_20690 [Candidatus Hydrogenedentes bacterium]|nr:hypothetical protein [Candidatus Hydrogenedentota bacterium]
MKHLRWVSKAPVCAQTITPERKLAFIEDAIRIMIPIVTNKNPVNPGSNTSTNT